MRFYLEKVVLYPACPACVVGFPLLGVLDLRGVIIRLSTEQVQDLHGSFRTGESLLLTHEG